MLLLSYTIIMTLLVLVSSLLASSLSLLLFGWHYLSDAPCLTRPHLSIRRYLSDTANSFAKIFVI